MLCTWAAITHWISVAPDNGGKELTTKLATGFKSVASYLNAKKGKIEVSCRVKCRFLFLTRNKTRFLQVEGGFMKLKDLFHRSRNETEGDAPDGFETDVMLERDPSGKIRRVEAFVQKDGDSDAPDA